MLSGATLFAGDSMTVGLPPFITVDGEKRVEAAVGRTAAQLLAALREPGPTGISPLDRSQNMVVLIGANDLGSQSAAQLTATILAIWALARQKGVRVIAMTIPPDKGWANFASNFNAINARRKAVNESLSLASASGQADALVDIAALMADPQDADKLAPAYDSGDHLHPRKDAFGALLNRAFAVLPPSSSLQAPTSASLVTDGNLGLVLLLGGAGLGLYLLTRNRWPRRLA